jgi:hypothetical protein
MEGLGKLNAGSEGLCGGKDVVEVFGLVDEVVFECILADAGGVELGEEGL